MACGEGNEIVMKIEEAILYVLAERNGGLRTEQIADIINRRKLHVRKDGLPVTSAQVYAVAMHHPDTFVKAGGADNADDLRLVIVGLPLLAEIAHYFTSPIIFRKDIPEKP